VIRGMLDRHVLGVRERGGNVLLVEPGAIIALDQERHAAARSEMSRPADRLIEAINSLNSIRSCSSGEIAVEPGGPE
jgi:hypothetical protein